MFLLKIGLIGYLIIIIIYINWLYNGYVTRVWKLELNQTKYYKGNLHPTMDSKKCKKKSWIPYV